LERLRHELVYQLRESLRASQEKMSNPELTPDAMIGSKTVWLFCRSNQSLSNYLLNGQNKVSGL